MLKYFDFYNNESKIQLETTIHPCPKCKCPNGVQLTRFKHEITVLKHTISLPNDMSVKYACKYCNWRRKALPDDDPFFHIFSDESSIENYFVSINHRYHDETDDDYSIVSTSSKDRPATSPTRSSVSSLSAHGSSSSCHQNQVCAKDSQRSQDSNLVTNNNRCWRKKSCFKKRH